MKLRVSLILLTAVVLVSGQIIRAQDTTDDAQTVEHLRARLSSLQANEADLKARLQELEFDLRPENIERYFSGVGSTRPEELREMRRRTLQAEKDRILAQLDRLTADRVRLESAVANAEAKAYQQSAYGAAALRSDQDLSAGSLTAMRVLVAIAIMVIALGGLVLVFAKRRQRRMQQQ